MRGSGEIARGTIRPRAALTMFLKLANQRENRIVEINRACAARIETALHDCPAPASRLTNKRNQSGAPERNRAPPTNHDCAEWTYFPRNKGYKKGGNNDTFGLGDALK